MLLIGEAVVYISEFWLKKKPATYKKINALFKMETATMENFGHLSEKHQKGVSLRKNYPPT